MKRNRYDVVVIGGGFYGCCLALYLASHGYSILLAEKEPRLMQRASAVNQARVHTGFHYPRSLATAVRSLLNSPRFIYEFRRAVDDRFTMLYAVARYGSKINARRFFLMFKELNAPIREASAAQTALFSPAQIEGVFAVDEYAFNHEIIRQILEKRLEHSGVEVALGTEVKGCAAKNGELELAIGEGVLQAKYAFNCTYSRINLLLERCGEKALALKHEIAEMVLVEPPEQLAGLAVTIMDGPFFSLMPYPAEQKYTLSHVRYTPHLSWPDDAPCRDPHALLARYPQKSNFPYMYRDALRFMPELELTPDRPLFEVKTVLVKNEVDDGRPIFYKEHRDMPNFHTVMGSKIDNVYDLFESMRGITQPFSKQQSAWRSILGLPGE